MLTIFIKVHRSYLDADKYSEDGMCPTFEIKVDESITIYEFINRVAPGGTVSKQNKLGNWERIVNEGEFFQDFGWYEFDQSSEDLFKNEDDKALHLFEKTRVFRKEELFANVTGCLFCSEDLMEGNAFHFCVHCGNENPNYDPKEESERLGESDCTDEDHKELMDTKEEYPDSGFNYCFRCGKGLTWG